MTILIIDGQGGKLGKLLVEKCMVSKAPEDTVIAVGTNAIATAAMRKAGAEAAATGENPVIVACRTADIIVGPIGILVADAMLGEITEKMTLAISRAGAKKVLLPVNQCGNLVAGTQSLSLSRVMDEAVELLKTLLA
jgi:hypothetical protein